MQSTSGASTHVSSNSTILFETEHLLDLCEDLIIPATQCLFSLADVLMKMRALSVFALEPVF